MCRFCRSAPFWGLLKQNAEESHPVGAICGRCVWFFLRKLPRQSLRKCALDLSTSQVRESNSLLRPLAVPAPRGGQRGLERKGRQDVQTQRTTGMGAGLLFDPFNCIFQSKRQGLTQATSRLLRRFGLRPSVPHALLSFEQCKKRHTLLSFGFLAVSCSTPCSAFVLVCLPGEEPYRAASLIRS